MKCLLLTAAVLLGSFGHAAAQVLAVESPRDAALGFGVAIEPEALVLGDALHALPTGEPRVSLALGGGFKAAVLLPARADVRVHALLQAIYRPGARWELGCMLQLFAAHAKNDAARSFGLGAELRCQPTYRLAAYRLGLDLGWQSTLGAHVAHTALSRRTFELRYPDAASDGGGPSDGWYALTAQRARLGLYVDRNLAARWGLRLALGTLFALQRQGLYVGFNVAQLPLYLELAARHAW